MMIELIYLGVLRILKTRQPKNHWGTTMNWCTNNCHEKPMWYGRKNCMNMADFSKAWQKKKDEKSMSDDGAKSSAEFNIELAAITLTEDFEALQ